MAGTSQVLVVSAPLVAVKVKAGDIRQLYRGDVVGDDVSAESIEHLKSLGYLEGTDGAEESDEPKGYADQKVDELKAEIESRNVDREDDAKLSTDGKKADLVAALEADDKAQAEN
jgi:hypothetical protein